MLKFCNHYKSPITTIFVYLGQLKNHDHDNAFRIYHILHYMTITVAITIT